jgi:soluble lytic murein transglycosylase-like protein
MASLLENRAIPSPISSHFTRLPQQQPQPAPTVSPVPATPQTSPPASPPSDLSSLIDKAASRYKLDPALISSVIETESGFNPKAVSGAGAQGLMQLMPATARELNVTDPFDPAQNIDGGSRYLSQLMKRYHGDAKLALAAYNWGMGNLESQPDKMPSETKNYVVSVMKRWDEKRTAVT